MNKLPAYSLVKTYINNPGHWIKNIIWRFPRTRSSQRIVFVVGAPRSGTTLLQRILAIHDHFFSIEKESSFFALSNIFTRYNLLGISKSENIQLFQTSKDIIDYIDKAIALLESNNSGSIYVDKAPQHVLHINKLLKFFPNSKIIHIYRDGRDCYCSAVNHPYIPQNRSIKTFASYWKRCIKSGYSENNHSRIFQISYEQFTREPQKIIHNIMNFLGDNIQKKQLDVKKISADKRSKKMYFSRLNESISPSSVDRWKNELSKKDQMLFEKYAGKELKILGYETYYHH